MSYTVEETIKYNQLFDVYQELLTDKQRQYFTYYFSDDYSLAEIGEILNVSRNAAHLQIKSIIKTLENFESKLHVNDLNEKIDELLIALKGETLKPKTLTIIKKIEKVK